MMQILIKDILRKVGNYPTYRIPYILREIGYIQHWNASLWLGEGGEGLALAFHGH